MFKPYQPSIAFSGERSVIYEEQTPDHSLQEYIFCYWRLHTPKPLEHPFSYRVVADGCIDILYEQHAARQIFATGFSTQYLEYDLGESFDYIGIRFLPTGFPAFFDQAAHQLTNEFLSLSEILPDFCELMIQSLNGAMDLTLASARFDELFKRKRTDQPPKAIDQRFSKAMNAILESGGRIPLSQLDVGVSERQLRRLFEFYFGESPKTFARIIRFQNILGAKPSIDSLKNNKIFYDEGYYDQAHFIKEFKAFYGVTPNKAFGR